MNIPNSESVQSFILQMSVYYEKEVGGFQIENNNDDIKLMILPFAQNDFNRSRSLGQFSKNSIRYSDGTWLYRKLEFKMISWFHTHPGSSRHEGYGFTNPSPSDIDFTNENFKVPGHIYCGRGGYHLMYSKLNK